MGRPMKEIGGSVKKNSKAYVVLNKNHRHFKRKSISLEAARRVDKTSCEQCRMCTDLCPRHLLGHNLQPHMSMRVMNYNLKSIQLKETAQLCSSCGLCEYFSCPIGLYPKSANDILKAELMEQGVKYKPTKTEFKALAVRSNRLIPSKRLIARLGLTPFNKPAPFIEIPESEIPEVKIMIRQNVGAAPEVIVAVGDHVEAGQMIGRIPEGKLSAPIHASISGTVTDISPEFITIRRG
jgi:Na+-translocating ferredoxin:NAD+ oxidoreductase RnfC subunit